MQTELQLKQKIEGKKLEAETQIMNTMQHKVKLLIVGLFCICNIVKCTDTTEVYLLCSVRMFGLLDQYAVDESTILIDLCYSTLINGYNYYTSSNDCHGHGVCNGALTQHDCSDCLNEAAYRMTNEWNHSRGAQIQLTDCRIRYEDFPFSE